MAVNIEEYLEARGFTQDPFARLSAEDDDASNLPTLFIRTAAFHRLVKSGSSALFARQGDGKTLHRREVARLARSEQALVIEFNDFDLFFERLDTLSISDYIDEFRRQTLGALAQSVVPQSEAERRLQQSEMYAVFCALLRLYQPQRLLNRWSAQAQLILEQRRAPQFRQPSREALAELAELARLVGFNGVFVLVDGIDDWPATDGQPAVMGKLLRPLLQSKSVLHDSGFTFKFFLPIELQPLVTGDYAEQGLSVDELSLSEEELHRILSRRLLAFSRPSPTRSRGLVERFDDLCDETVVAADARLVRAAGRSPRRLLWLARRVIDEHCRAINQLDVLIGAEVFERVLNGQQQAPPPPAQPAPPPQPAPEVPLLFVDKRGDVFVGDQPLPKRLSPLPQRCLAYLWDHRDERVELHTLVYAVYSKDITDKGQEDNLKMIIRRLRETLEPEATPSSSTYIEGTPTTGYTLRNTRPGQERERNRTS
jgi:DNA-binding winged helix-turn-helix (wHTH) protein